MGRDDIYRFVASFCRPTLQHSKKKKKNCKDKNFSSFSRAITAFVLAALSVEATDPIGSVSCSG